MSDQAYWHGIDGTHFTDEQTYVIEKLYQAFKERMAEELPQLAIRQVLGEVMAAKREEQLKPCQWCGRKGAHHSTLCPNGPAP